MKNRSLFVILFFVLIGTVSARLYATDHRKDRPFWTEKSIYVEGDYVFAVGVASNIDKVENGRHEAFMNGRQEIANMMQLPNLGKVSIETQMTYEEPLENGKFNVYRLLKADYPALMELQKNLKESTPLQVNPPTPTPPPAETSVPQQQTDREKIAGYEKELKDNPGTFNWRVHNELRHLYGAFSEEKSLEHSDIILQHSVMDDYILKILSSWEIGKDSDKAIVNLLYWPTTYPQMKFVQAACWLEMADIYASMKNKAKADSYYQQVIQTKAADLARYRTLAQMRLDSLAESSPKAQK